MHKLLQLLRSNGPLGVLRFGRHWLSEKYNERRLGVRTAGYVPLADLGLAAYEDRCVAYEPIDYRSLFRALNAIHLRPGEDVFVDYGCGMGRALVAAATYPFKRVIGVELSPQLAEAARRNITKAGKRLRCRQVEVVTIDATTYEPPDDVSVILMYNPFSTALVLEVLDRLLASRARAPRRLTVIFKFPDWTSDPFRAHPAFRCVAEQSCYSDAGERLRIYETV